MVEMDALGLCKPATLILLIASAGAIYHLVVGQFTVVLWWLVVGILGTGLFQGLCFGNLEPIAWVIMLIPVLIVCFFLAVALFASRMRIENIMKLPCNRCGGDCPGPCRRKPWCNKTRTCGDDGDHGNGSGGYHHREWHHYRHHDGDSTGDSTGDSHSDQCQCRRCLERRHDNE